MSTEHNLGNRYTDQQVRDIIIELLDHKNRRRQDVMKLVTTKCNNHLRDEAQVQRCVDDLRKSKDIDEQALVLERTKKEWPISGKGPNSSITVRHKEPITYAQASRFLKKHLEEESGKAETFRSKVSPNAKNVTIDYSE